MNQIYSDNPSKADAAKFLYRASFGPKPEDVNNLVSTGYEAWFEEQISQPVSGHLQTTKAFESATGDGYFENARLGAFWFHAISSEDQLRQRMTYALSQIFVVSHVGVWGAKDRAHYYDLLAEHAFGNFKDLLKAVTISPAMGKFLTLDRSSKANPEKNTYPDENYAREVMQLFTIGLWRLKRNGLPVLKSGKKVPSYTQDDVQELARVLTGWRRSDFYTPMHTSEKDHDLDKKRVLGKTFLAGQSAEQDLDQAVDILFNHNNTPAFISLLLIQRFTISNPRRSYVYRVAEVFKNNGQGVRGDLVAVIKAILLDNDVIKGVAMSDNQDIGHGSNNFGKVKEPIIAMANFARALGVYSNSAERWWDSIGTQSNFGQAPLRANSVFNFYQADSAPEGLISDLGLTAPEFTIMNSDVMLRISNRMWNVIYSSRFTQANKWTWNRKEFELTHDKPHEYVELINERLFAGLMSVQLANQITEVLASYPIVAVDQRIWSTLFLAQSSAEFRCQE